MNECKRMRRDFFLFFFFILHVHFASMYGTCVLPYTCSLIFYFIFNLFSTLFSFSYQWLCFDHVVCLGEGGTRRLIWEATALFLVGGAL